MKILILGSQGFIGSHLVNFFVNQKSLVVGCDLIENSSSHYVYHKLSVNSSDFESVFLSDKFDFCINASGSGNVSYSFEHPLSDFESNTLAIIKVLETIRKVQPLCKYVHISSAAVYGNPGQLPIKESDVPQPLSPYGWHKYMSEMICKEYHLLYNLKIVIIRPFSVYGNGLRKQLLWDLCNKISIRKDVELFGTGMESRDFIHIDDLVYAVDCILKAASFNNEIYNVAGGKETTIRELAEIFENYLSNDKKIRFSGLARVGDPLNWRADINNLAHLGFIPKVKLQEGVVNYIKWYQSLEP